MAHIHHATIVERITIAHQQLKSARRQDEPERELAWDELLDRLLQRYSDGER